MEYTFLARLLEDGKIDTLKNILKENLSILNENKLHHLNTTKDYVNSLSHELNKTSLMSIATHHTIAQSKNNPSKNNLSSPVLKSPPPIPSEAINAATPMIHNTLINRAIVMTKDIELIELLLGNGADIYQYNLYYQNAISLSLSMAHENKLWNPIADLIMSQVPLHVSLKLGHENKYYNLAMIYSTFCFESSAIDALSKGVLPYEKSIENNIFLIASEKNQMELIDYLIKHYPNHALNLPSDESQVNYYFLIACYQQNEPLCQYLIDHTIISEKTLEQAHLIETSQTINTLINIMKEKFFLSSLLKIENEENKKHKKI
jgi:hypothetical protein